MPRQSGVSVQNNFVKGLVTEATALSFPENACISTDNIVFDPTGRVKPRLGFDYESSYVSSSYSTANQDNYSSFVWNAVAGDGNISFLVQQMGSTLRFFDISNDTNISANHHATEINIASFLATNSDHLPQYYECQFASGNGNLFVTNPACDPFYVTYDVATNDFTTTEITLLERDFEGLDDGIPVTERPTDTLAGLETSNPNHYYNLLNQGWGGPDDALSQWDTARSDLPSNTDYVGLSRASTTDAFDNSIITSKVDTPSNRPAPKGHFIIEVASKNRQEVLEDAGYTFNTTSDSFSMVSASTGTIFTNFTILTSRAFDDNLEQGEDECARKNSSTSAYMGKNFGSSPKTIAKVRLYPTNDAGNGFVDNNNYPVVITLYGKNSLPANGTDGTNLGSVSVPAFTNDPVTINSNDTTTTYQYIWCNLVPNASDDILLAEMQMFSGTLGFERPSCVEFYAGRVFYGGIATSALSNNIYFSQIIENVSQYGYCYQANDPTSEDFPDLLPDDGGFIKIPEMGTLKKLFSYQNALLAFATNGIWLISGSSGASFKADDYVVKKISSIGMNSPQSLCSIKGLPAWWGEDGIYTVTFDPNYDSFTPTSLTLTVIDSFYESIPLANKKYAKCVYDETAKIAYWVYNDDADLNSDKYKYNSVLCLDGKSKAWYTWSISAGPIVRTVSYVKPADRSSDGKLKFLINPSFDGTVAFTSTYTFADVLDTNYVDWASTTSPVYYETGFTTGYRIDGQTQRFFQPLYVFVFLEAQDNASCFMQGVFDYTTSSAEGKWSTKQQIYNENLTNRGVNFRKLKVRGKGRALQLMFEGEPGKPFTIIGWSIAETASTGV